jgi:hypothetical protein
MLSERFEMRFSPELVEKIDQWRQAQPVPPSRAAAIRYLIESGLEARQVGAPSSDGSARGSSRKPATGKRASAPKAKALRMSKEAQIRAMREQGAE